MLIWQAVVLHGGSSGCDIQYSFGKSGTNCFKWTWWATLKAKAISKLPFGG